MTINAIFAINKFGGMGFKGSLPWPHTPEDMAHFKKHTAGHIVVMGRDTWDDPKMPKPLVGREVYVATNRRIKGATPISGNIKDALLKLEKENPTKKIWVIGGPNLLKQCDGMLDKLYITHFHGVHRTDCSLDLKSFLSGWLMHSATSTPNSTHTFVTYVPLFKRAK